RTTTPMPEVIAEMSRKTFGMTCVVDAHGALAGVITDGDLRRQIEKGVDVRGLTAADVMSRGPIAVGRSTLAAEALNIMETRHITSLVVVDHSNCVAGVVHLHDLWRTEMI
ncbi:MAG TPA: CBS domain-containing protein, partial [Vicinamibacterales bacterium]|nr:CBS domain-containing protein [Vicinamibacterales bacterium]